MAWAKLDAEGRILEASEDEMVGLDAEFSNFDEFCERCKNGVEDWVVRDGLAVYEPRPEKEIETLKARLAETDYIAAKMADEMAGCMTPDDIIAVTASYAERYGEVLRARAEWRRRIDELGG